MRRKHYALLAPGSDVASRPILDEDEHELPAFRHGGVAHPVPPYDPAADPTLLPGGLRPPREPMRRMDDARVIVTLQDVEWDLEEPSGVPIDYGGRERIGPLGMAGLSDFPRYHYNPEADEMSALPLPPSSNSHVFLICPPHAFPAAVAYASISPQKRYVFSLIASPISRI